MAEIAIPVVALGALYIMSNHNKKTEGFQANRRNLTNNEVINFPVQKDDFARNDVNQYSGSSHKGIQKYNPSDKVQQQTNINQNGNNFESLSGETMHRGDMTHNNMQPYFGSTITQNVNRNHEGLLDKYTGAGSQNVEKQAQAPMFAPQKNMAHTHGMPSTTSYIQERMRGNITTKMNNVKPWEEIKVGPGLNKGYGTEGSGGFNSGMESRDKWLPKTVDQLRVDTNPKNTYKGQLLGPYAGRSGAGRGIHGRVNKNQPDTFYVQNADRWLTTTGMEKAPTQQAPIIMRDTNANTTREYFGTGGETQAAGGPQQPGHYRQSHRNTLDPYNKYLGGASAGGKGEANSTDYGKNGVNIRTNNRALTGATNNMGNAYNQAMNALAAPILDVLRPSRKENVIGNMRPMGNARGQVGVDKGRVWDPRDRPKTTIKEQTENNEYIGMGTHMKGGGYNTNKIQPTATQRDTTTCSFTGNAAAGEGNRKGKLYNAAYNARLNPNRQVVSKVDRYHVGNQKLYNNNQNVTNLRNRATNRAPVYASMPKSSSGTAVLGESTGNHRREAAIGCGRAQSDILSPFRNNPYTHSLSSVA